METFDMRKVKMETFDMRKVKKETFDKWKLTMINFDRRKEKNEKLWHEEGYNKNHDIRKATKKSLRKIM